MFLIENFQFKKLGYAVIAIYADFHVAQTVMCCVVMQELLKCKLLCQASAKCMKVNINNKSRKIIESHYSA